MGAVNAAGQDSSEQLLSILNLQGSGNVEAVNSGTAVTISDPTIASTTVLTLNGATPAITLPVPRKGLKKRLFLVQDATGSRIPSWVVPGGAVKWVGAAAPTLQTAAAAVDSVAFECYDGVNLVGIPSLHIA